MSDSVMKLPAVPPRGSAVSAEAVMKLEKGVSEQLSRITNIDVLTEWRSQAAALEAYLRGKELQRPMLGAQRRVEARIGQLLGDPQAAQLSGHLSPMTERLAKDDRQDFRILAKALNGDCPIDKEEWRKSRRALVMLIRQRLGLMPVTPPLPDGKFSVIVADPPWQLDTGPDAFNTTGEGGHDQLAYAQMSVESISALKVETVAADDSHLYLWTTNKYVELAYSVARAWGFKPSVLLVWAKNPRGIGLGDAYKLTTEFVLYARRGSLKELTISPRTWFDWPRSKHSVKPDGFYQLVESMSPAPRLEMFSRKSRDGWTIWGEEAPNAPC